MAEWCAELEVQVWAYCSMPIHVHLIAVPASADGLRRGERTGRPAGSAACVALLEGLTGRRLERQKPSPKRAEGS